MSLENILTKLVEDYAMANVLKGHLCHVFWLYTCLFHYSIDITTVK